MKRVGWLSLICLVAPRLFPQTILVYVDDTADGRTTPGRAVVREGVYAALFEGGYVFFDPGALAMPDVDWSTGFSADLRDAALDGDAAYILVARARTVTTRRDAGRPRIDIRVQVHVLRLYGYTARTIVTEDVETSNTGREDTVDLSALGSETGALVTGVLDRVLATAVRRVLLDRMPTTS